MKHVFPLLLTALLLCGCARDPHPAAETTFPTAAPTEAAGLYDPGSSLEAATHSAVRVYPLDDDSYYGIRPMGDSILALRWNETAILTKLSGETLVSTASVSLDAWISFEDPSVQVSDKGVTYYDEMTQELVFLDTSLKEVSRFPLPEDILGTPVLSADRKSLYYCTGDSLRVLDLETKLNKLLKEMSFSYQVPVGLHCGDRILECNTQDSAGQWARLFISIDNGQTIQESRTVLALSTNQTAYFAVNSDGAYLEMLYGTIGQEPLALSYPGIHSDAVPLLSRDSVVLISQTDGFTDTTLDHYDLATGKHTATLEFSDGAQPYSFFTDTAGDIYFLRYDAQTGADAIYRWTPEGTPTGDETVYFAPRHSYEAPDLDGLARCTEIADEISQRHSIQILLWQDAVSVQPSDYTLEAEYQVPLILDCLEQLDQALGNYPTGFLKKAAIGTDSGVLRICLVRGIYGDSSLGSLDQASGLQFWDGNEDAYVCLIASSDLPYRVHHELFHVIDNRVLSTCSAYDTWNDLNPEGFEYDYNYLLNLSRKDDDWINGDNAAFIDLYSMSFPKEDRARIMEYAMMDDCADTFASPILQKKLYQLCLGIRQAFDLEVSGGTYLWEQYLQNP